MADRVGRKPVVNNRGEVIVSPDLLSRGVSISDLRVLLIDLREVAPRSDLLDEAERGRAERFIRAEDRDRFIRAHCSLRVVLGSALGVPPEDIRFGQDPSGKPRLVEVPAIAFNLSHSGDHALIGIARGVEVGVDVETERALSLSEIARLALAPEELDELAEVSEPRARAAFFDLWARKEALLKAEGSGLRTDPRTLRLGLHVESQVVVHGSRRWRVRRLESGRNGLHAAVAYEASGDQNIELVWESDKLFSSLSGLSSQ